MRTKKLTVLFITILFVFCIVLSGVFVFSIKKVDAEYSTSEKTDVLSVQKTLDEYLGKNLLFCNVDEIYNSLKNHHYLKVLEVEKKFPNVITLKIEERKEVFYTVFQEETYLLDETGFVLKKCDSSEAEGLSTRRDIIELSFTENASITEVKIGSIIKTSDDELFASVLEVASSVNLYDFIKSIRVEVKSEGYTESEGYRDMVMTTYAGGEISIWKVFEKGVLKMKTLLLKYNEASDYIKTKCNAAVYESDDGQIIISGLTEE